MDKSCPKCFGLGWVCENHPNLPWSEEIGCICGAGMQCSCNRADDAGVEDPNISEVLIGKSDIVRH
jgi:hypothetical protein